MSPQSTNPVDISAVSAAISELPDGVECTLPDGRKLCVRRLSWLQFEALWSELSGLVSALASVPQDAAPEQLAAAFASAPAAVLKLCQAAAELPESELAALPYDAVLSLASAALKLNFIDSAGLRSFFATLARLPGAVG